MTTADAKDDGRLCASQNAIGPGAVVYYIYDAEGNRVAKGGSSTNPYPSVLACTDGSDFAVTATYAVGLSGEQLTEYDASHTPKHTNVYAGSQLLATYDFNGATSTLHYRILDPLGTMRVQTNAFGSVEEHCFNLPFWKIVLHLPDFDHAKSSVLSSLSSPHSRRNYKFVMDHRITCTVRNPDRL